MSRFVRAKPSICFDTQRQFRRQGSDEEFLRRMHGVGLVPSDKGQRWTTSDAARVTRRPNW